MADHIISLTDRQENSAARIVERANTIMGQANLTVDEWMKNLILSPIKAEIAAKRAADTALVVEAYDAATREVKDQVDAILGL